MIKKNDKCPNHREAYRRKKRKRRRRSWKRRRTEVEPMVFLISLEYNSFSCEFVVVSSFSLKSLLMSGTSISLILFYFSELEE